MLDPEGVAERVARISLHSHRSRSHTGRRCDPSGVKNAATTRISLMRHFLGNSSKVVSHFARRIREG